MAVSINHTTTLRLAPRRAQTFLTFTMTPPFSSGAASFDGLFWEGGTEDDVVILPRINPDSLYVRIYAILYFPAGTLALSPSAELPRPGGRRVDSPSPLKNFLR